MPDYYHGPALILTALLLPAFGFLYFRSRDLRTLLWFLGFFFALVSMGLLYPIGLVRFASSPWSQAIGQSSLQISSALFLGSLSPLTFRIGRFPILFVIPYTIPLVAASILLYGVFPTTSLSGPLFFVFPLLVALSFGAGMIWGTQKGTVPEWLGVAFSGMLGCAALWVCNVLGPAQSLTFIECVNLQMTVVLLIFVFRRFSPGVLLSVLGFSLWSFACVRLLPWVSFHPEFETNLLRVIAMAKVVAALGMIVLALEDELNINQAARERERKARLQLEAYTNLMLTRRRVEDFDHQAPDICELIVQHSRFTQAALLLQSEGRYRLAGCAGIEVAVAKPLADLVERIKVAGFLNPDVTPAAAENTMTRRLDLTPWLVPGDDLERLRFTSVLAVPMWSRNSADGALLLKGMRTGGRHGGHAADQTPNPDDLLPIEMLVTRLQATRSQTTLFEKLIDAEKFAGLGQLASNVTQQLNNPLTVILGYATLLHESASLDAQDRKGVGSIITEARRIRSTLESLSRVSRAHADIPTAVSVAEMLTDVEQLYRTQFLQRSIDFHVTVAPGLPRVMCGEQQLRQAVVHCLQYAMGAIERAGQAPDHQEKTIRLEAATEGNLVQISVSHTGQSFLHQERAFDPFAPAQADSDTVGLGLSLCATILRDQNGRASAVNLEPHGAAIILELQAA